MRANNLDAYVNWFNRLTYFVATEICMVSEEHDFICVPFNSVEIYGQILAAVSCCSVSCVT